MYLSELWAQIIIGLLMVLLVVAGITIVIGKFHKRKEQNIQIVILGCLRDENSLPYIREVERKLGHMVIDSLIEVPELRTGRILPKH